MNLGELHVPEDADDATRWAIWEEFNLRRERYEAHERFEREGVVGAFKRLSEVVTGTAVREPLYKAE